MSAPRTPEGFVWRSTPQEITRRTEGRIVVCPRCGAGFETMRRFRMACAECAHVWQEESELGFNDWMLDAREKAAFALVAGPVLFFFCAAFILVAVLVVRSGIEFVLTMLLVLALMFVIARGRH